MKDTCLVLEGGGMRGMYTSGVLDAFMDNNLFINNVYAVSAGCYNALSYISKQRGRSFRINTTFLNDKRYINIKRMIAGKSAINTDFIFNDVFKELDPFDYKTFKNCCGDFKAVSTNCLSGEAHYQRIQSLEEDVEYVKASAALPLFAKLVKVDNLILTDGGMSDSIPVKRAIEDGYVNNIVILTRPKDYVMKESRLLKLYKIKYKKYPNLIKTMENRPVMYNETLKLVNRLEENNRAIVIRPSESLNISNLEKNEERIKEIYDMGYKDGIKYIDIIRAFIGGEQNEKEKDRRI